MENIVAFAVLGVFVAVVGYKYMKGRTAHQGVQQHLQAQPMLQAGAPLVDGSMVRVSGVVRPMQTVVAPLSGRVCVAYRTLITHDVPSFRDMTQPNTAETFEMTPFMIDRGAEGPVIIDGSYAQLVVRSLHDSQLEMVNKEKFVLARGLSMREAVLARFSETVIEAGMTVTVAGTLVSDGGMPGGTAGYRDGGQTVRLTGTPQAPLVIGA